MLSLYVVAVADGKKHRPSGLITETVRLVSDAMDGFRLPPQQQSGDDFL